MIDSIIKYHAVLFAPLQEIQPKPETLSYFIQFFEDKELIPNNLQEVINGTIINRFEMKSANDSWRISFLGDRVDIEKKNSNFGVIEMGTQLEFIEEVKKISRGILEKYPKKANRLSLITQYIFDEMNDEDQKKIYFAFTNPIASIKENPPVEWTQRATFRTPKIFNEKNEMMNFVCHFDRIKGNLIENSNPKRIDRVRLSLDLNTVKSNSDFRFDQNDIDAFYNSVVNWEKDIRQEYIDKISNLS